MSEEREQLLAWCQEVTDFHLPRWQELPDIELYMDQVITLIERYLSSLAEHPDGKVITAAMINNYVKLGIMPKPEKKRYGRIHLAYLLVISILKQILTINEVKDGILLQIRLHGQEKAYDEFCKAQEQALWTAFSKAGLVSPQHQEELPYTVPQGTLALHMATTSFASKIITQKIIFIHKKTANLIKADHK